MFHTGAEESFSGKTKGVPSRWGQVSVNACPGQQVFCQCAGLLLYLVIKAGDVEPVCRPVVNFKGEGHERLIAAASAFPQLTMGARKSPSPHKLISSAEYFSHGRQETQKVFSGMSGMR